MRFRRSFMGASSSSSSASAGTEGATPTSPAAASATSTTLRRSSLAGMLSEALCSRAKRVSETRGIRKGHAEKKNAMVNGEGTSTGGPAVKEQARDVPFAKRAREQGKLFEGGKPDGESQ